MVHSYASYPWSAYFPPSALLNTPSPVCITLATKSGAVSNPNATPNQTLVIPPLQPCPVQEAFCQLNISFGICVSVHQQHPKVSWTTNTIDFCSSWNFPRSKREHRRSAEHRMLPVAVRQFVHLAHFCLVVLLTAALQGQGEIFPIFLLLNL